MRWRMDLSYLGTNYSGWQKQTGDKTIQQTIEEALHVVTRQDIEITGCGRTDAGVHARNYTAHFDAEQLEDNASLIYKLNAVLPRDISINKLGITDDVFHARYDAIERHYLYHIHFYKNPFLHGQSLFFSGHVPLDRDAMHEAALLILQHNEFFTFCKMGSDVKHYNCTVNESKWTFSDDMANYSIKANRFLRGMVRLITGACLNIGLGKLSVATLSDSLKNQMPLPIQLSVPAEGLYLESVKYLTDEN